MPLPKKYVHLSLKNLEKKEKEVNAGIRLTNIVRKTEESKLKVVAIDAPLSLPSGRKSIEQRTSVHLRGCDKQLLKRGTKFFSVAPGL